MPYISKAVDEALTTEVFNRVKQVERMAINQVVYVKDPKVYKRRFDQNHGFADPRNIKLLGEPVDNTIAVVNTAKPNVERNSYRNAESWMRALDNSDNKDLPSLVEFGHSPGAQHRHNRYDFPRAGRWYMKPRLFTQETRNRLKQSGDIKTTVWAGLTRQGFHVEGI